MFKKKSKIYIKDWMALKPYENQSNTDLYYLALCNKVQNKIGESNTSLLTKYLSKKDLVELPCFLVSYFEDIISETNIWNAFITKHQDLYGKKLPFYDTTNYFENEINIQDLQFLVWYFINSKQENRFIWPSNPFLWEIADAAMEVFDREYEFAPENEFLKAQYTLPANAVFYEARDLMYKLFTDTYLFSPDTVQRYRELIGEITSSRSENLIYLLREGTDRFAFSTYSKLLSLKANEWAAAVLGKEHPLYNYILNISERASGGFFYKGQNQTEIDLEHIATGRKFKLAKKSYDDHDILKKNGIITLGMVKWKNEWWFSGISSIGEYDADYVEKQKKSKDARSELNFLEGQEKVKEILQLQENAFFDFNDGSPVAFLKKDKVDDFAEKFMDYYNKSLGTSEKEKREAEQRLKEIGILKDEENEKIPLETDSENAVVFFNPNSGLEFYYNIGSVFPFKENPFYDPKEKDADFIEMLLSDFHSKEILQFCAKNFKENLEFFERKEQYDNHEFDFLLRFFKNDIYNTKPRLTMLG